MEMGLECFTWSDIFWRGEEKVVRGWKAELRRSYISSVADTQMHNGSRSICILLYILGCVRLTLQVR